jgi:hypothetical protein
MIISIKSKYELILCFVGGGSNWNVLQIDHNRLVDWFLGLCDTGAVNKGGGLLSFHAVAFVDVSEKMN